MKDLKIIKNIEKKLLYEMYRIRNIEFKIAEYYSEQEMRCPVHLSIGQEAVAVGICSYLKKSDSVLSAHRSHAHYVAKGGSLEKMLGELYGKETGCAQGKGGSMHLIDLDAGFLAAVPIVGSTIPIAVGTAWAKKLKRDTSKTVVFLGEGATETGVFHESLGFAALHNVPIIFICENNLYSVYTHLRDRQSPNRSLKEIVEGHGIKHFHGNGNSVEDVSSIFREGTFENENNAPVFFEFDTYRWLEHCGPNYDDHLKYREDSEVSMWKDRCPINTFEKKLIDEGILSHQELEKYLEKLNIEIEEAFKKAKKSSFLSKEHLYEKIYSD